MSQGGEDGQRASSLILRYFVMTRDQEVRFRLARIIQYMLRWDEAQLIAFWNRERITSAHIRQDEADIGTTYCVNAVNDLVANGHCVPDTMGAQGDTWLVPASPGRVQPYNQPGAVIGVSAFVHALRSRGLDGLLPWLPTGQVTVKEYGIQRDATFWLCKVVAPYVGAVVTSRVIYMEYLAATLEAYVSPENNTTKILVPVTVYPDGTRDSAHAIFLFVDVVDRSYTIYDPNGYDPIEAKLYTDAIRRVLPNYILYVPPCVVIGTQASGDLPYCTAYASLTMLFTILLGRSPVEVDGMLRSSAKGKMHGIILRYDRFLEVLANGHHDGSPDDLEPHPEIPKVPYDAPASAIAPSFTSEFNQAFNMYHADEPWKLLELGFQPDVQHYNMVEDLKYTMRHNMWGSTYIMPSFSAEQDNEAGQLVVEQCKRFLPNVDLDAPLGRPKVTWNHFMALLPPKVPVPSQAEQAYRGRILDKQKLDLVAHQMLLDRMRDRPLVHDTLRPQHPQGPQPLTVPPSYILPDLDEAVSDVNYAIEQKDAYMFMANLETLRSLIEQPRLQVYQHMDQHRQDLDSIMAFYSPDEGIYDMPRLRDGMRGMNQESVRHLLEAEATDDWWVPLNLRKFINLSLQKLDYKVSTAEWMSYYTTRMGVEEISYIRRHMPELYDKHVLQTIHIA